MRCPVDRGELESLEVSGEHLHSCPRCHGSWLKVASLESLARKPLTFVAQTEPGAPCPACERTLAEGILKEADLTASYCSQCNCYWLGSGVLSEVLRQVRSTTRSGVKPPPAPPAPKPLAGRRLSVPKVAALLTGLALLVGSLVWLNQMLLASASPTRLAQMAWEVRQSDALQSTLADVESPSELELARLAYLQGNPRASLSRLARETDERSARLRRQAVEAALYATDWPARVVAGLDADLESERTPHLVRVLDSGLKKAPELSLDVLGYARGSYDTRQPQWLDPDGEAAPKLELSRVERLYRARLTGATPKDVLLRYRDDSDRQCLLVLTADQGRLVGYLFRSEGTLTIHEDKSRIDLVKDGKTRRYAWNGSGFGVVP